MSDSDEDLCKQEFAYIKLWPAILEEYKNGSRKEEAFRNVYRKSGRNPPSYFEAQIWLEYYYDGDIGEEIDNFRFDVRAAIIGQYLKFQNAIYFSGNWKFNNMEATLYSRFVFVHSSRYPKGFSVIDSFSGERRALKDPTHSIGERAFYSPIWIDPTHILAKRDGRPTTRLLLLNFDWDKSKLAVLDTFVFQAAQILIDSVDSTKFALNRQNPDSTSIHRGQIIENRIVMEGQPFEVFARLRYPKFENNQLCGFQEVRNEENNRQEWHFENYILEENSGRKVSSVKVGLRHTELNEKYIWSKNRLFVLVYSYDQPKYFTVAAFNSDTYFWSETKIVGTAFPNSITIDEDEILTIGTLDGDWTESIQPIYKTVHRFPMRKPEKLSFLAWASIRRGKMFFDSDIHDKLQLPYTCEFRPFF